LPFLRDVLHIVNQFSQFFMLQRKLVSVSYLSDSSGFYDKPIEDLAFNP